jgi:hypothetical protein
MESRTFLSKLIYRIEPKPGGGFIATSKDSTAAIEGATREEVQRKIQESIATTLSAQFPALQSALANHGVTLHYHVEAKPGGGFLIHHGDPSSGDSTHVPEGSTRDHIENLIESKIFSALINRLPPELHQQIADKLNSGGLDIDVTKNISVTTSTGGLFAPVFGKESVLGLDQNPASDNSSALGKTELATDETANQSPIVRYDGNSPVQYEKSSSGSIIRFLLALAVIAALMYFFLYRR